MKQLNAVKFFREVRQEVSKVTWPTRKETMLSITMVIVLAGLAALFFFIVDSIISYLVRLVLGLGG